MSDVSLHRGEEEPLSVELALNAIPEAKSSQTGVSVRYVPDPNKHWFVFRSSYGRSQISADYLIEKGIYPYVAMQYANRHIRGKKKRILKPLIPSILFAYATSEEADKCIDKSDVSSHLSYYYDHFNKENGMNPPLTIKEKEMLDFIKVTSTHNMHLKFVDAEHCHFKTGEMVKVTEGPFKGIEGKVARVAGQQRVVIAISNIGMISTAYIPTAFLEAKSTTPSTI